MTPIATACRADLMGGLATSVRLLSLKGLRPDKTEIVGRVRRHCNPLSSPQGAIQGW
jgi:hypothetical protein